MKKPIVWTIAGSDCSGGAGIQADLLTFNAIGVHGCSVIAALTAQNSVELKTIEFTSPALLRAQLDALASDLKPKAIKLGMIGSLETLSMILPYLEQFPQAIVYDPVLFASVGGPLHQGDLRQFLIQHFLKKITVFTPNIPEAEWLLGIKISTNLDMESAAKEIQALGPQVVLLKGGHGKNQLTHAQDYWTNGIDSGWLSSPRWHGSSIHGTGCTLSSAIAACLARSYEIKEALVLAKAYLNQGIRLGSIDGAISHQGWPSTQFDFPILTSNSVLPASKPFPSCGPQPLGFYPIVENAEWVERILSCGVNTIQLRIKNLPEDLLKKEIQKSIALAEKYKARLFINDYWPLAIECGAYGVHLGQEDLDEADCEMIRKAGLRLGISTHSYYEIARAMAYQPSYIACGPIFTTTTKDMRAAPQGLVRLEDYCRLLDCPVVAIGGIQFEDLLSIMKTGADGIAVISAITKAKEPEHEVTRWVRRIRSLDGAQRNQGSSKH